MPSSHNMHHSLDGSTCISSASSHTSGNTHTTSDEKTHSLRANFTPPDVPDIAKRRMQVKLGRVNSPKTLIGIENEDEGEITAENDEPHIEEGNANIVNHSNNFERDDRCNKLAGQNTNNGIAPHYQAVNYGIVDYVSLNHSQCFENPEVALDNVNVNGFYEHLESESNKMIQMLQEDELNLPEQRPSTNLSSKEDCSRDEPQVEDRNTECIPSTPANEPEPYLYDKILPQNNITANASPLVMQHIASSNQNDRRRALYRTDSKKDISNSHEQCGTATELAFCKQSTSNERPGSQISVHSSRPSSCSLPVSCCSSRISNVEEKDNKSKLANTIKIDITNKDDNAMGSYGDILNVLEKLEQETNETDVNGCHDKKDLRSPSSQVSSMRSSSTYLDITPRAESSQNNDFEDANSNFKSEYEKQHLRSSSKMR